MKFDLIKTHFRGLYDYLKDYYKRNKLNASDLDCFERIIKVVGWNCCATNDSIRIETAIDETQKFLESRGYFEYGNLSKYFGDMTLLVDYARKDIFNRIRDKVILDKNKGNWVLWDFFKKILNNESLGTSYDMEDIGIKDIKISLDKKHHRKIVIDDSKMIKDMLDGLAKQYMAMLRKPLMYIQKYQEWDLQEALTYFMDGMNVLVYMYVWIFLCDEDLFGKVDSEECKYFLLGRLLVIAGLEEYDETDSSYENEADYYYKSLKVREVKEENEKIEKTIEKFRWKNQDLVYKKRVHLRKYEDDFYAIWKKCKTFVKLEKPLKIDEVGLWIEEKDYDRIRSTMDETQSFFKDRGYFEYVTDYFSRFSAVELVIYAQRHVFNKPKWTDEYWDGIIDLVKFYYWKIILDWEFLSEVESDELNYLLLGRLLVIAGFEEYNKDNSSYENEADYYYIALNVKEIIDYIDVSE